jgi:hypothetical protein
VYRLPDPFFDVIYPKVNVVSHVLLTLELLPVMLTTAASAGDCRILFVSSRASFNAWTFNADRIVVTEEPNYDRLRTYSTTKLYNVSNGGEGKGSVGSPIKFGFWREASEVCSCPTLW